MVHYVLTTSTSMSIKKTKIFFCDIFYKTRATLIKFVSVS